jgi:glycosyltransferase involved in cell wall biosynthesis
LKILIDAQALSISGGTGVTTYAQQLCATLQSGQHEVQALYGLDFVNPPHGQSMDGQRWQGIVAAKKPLDIRSPKQMAAALWYALRYLPAFLSGRSTQIEQVLVDAQSLPLEEPYLERRYNLALLYRAAGAYSYFSRKPLQIHLPESDHVDIFHATTELPIRVKGVPNVVTLHDVIPLAFKENRQRFPSASKNRWLAALSSADMVFAVSEQSRCDAVKYLGIPQDRIHVIYQTSHIAAKYRGVDLARLTLRLATDFGLVRGKYLLFFGTLEHRKNIVRMLEAMQLAKTDLPLVLVGNYGYNYENEKQLIEQRLSAPDTKLRHLPYQTEDALMHLIKGARAVLFPSLFEGFGLPVLESMQLGVPVITSNSGAVREVGGDVPFYVDPRNTNEIAQAIDRLASDDELCTELSRKGLIRAQAFAPERYLKRLEEGYALAIRNWKQANPEFIN